MTDQRLPIVGSDDGAWGDLLNKYLTKEHYDTGFDNVANGGHKTITVQPGTTSAGTAPIKLTSGPLMNTAEVGAIEFNTDAYYGTITTGAARKQFAFTADVLKIDQTNPQTIINGTPILSDGVKVESPTNTVISATKTLETFDYVQHFLQPSTYTNDTVFVKPGYYSVTGDVLNTVGDFLYLGKDTIFTDIYFGFGTILSVGTDRTWEYWNGTAWTSVTVTDGTNQWQNDGIVNFTAPGDWATTTVNAIANLYWLRVGTLSGTFTIEPTLKMCVPSAAIPASTLEVYSGDTGVPDVIVDKKGNVGIGFLDPGSYKLRVNGSIAGTSFSGGNISGASGAFSSAITNTLSTTGQTHVGGNILNGPAATLLLPSQNSPVNRMSAQAWNGYITKINAMDIYVNPDSEVITKARMAFKNTTTNGYPDASELMNITSDGTLNVIGLAQPRNNVFDNIQYYVSSVYTDITALVSNFGNITGDVLNATNDIIYFGKRNLFSQIQIVIGTAKSTGGTFVWEYWNGTAWVALTVTDGTVNGTLGPLSQSGNVDITIPGDWVQSYVGSGTASIGPLYYCRLKVTGGAFTTEPTLQLALPNTSLLLTGEIFNDTTFDTGLTKWAVTGGWAYTTGSYTFTWVSSTTTGTLKQAVADFKNPAKPNTWYRFRYQVGVVGPTGTSAWIGSEFADGNTYFQVSSTTEIDCFFKTNSNPGDFIIYTTATADSGLVLNGVSLTELKDGNIANTGLYTGGGPKGLKVDYLGNVGIGMTTPTAKLHLEAGTATAGTAPLKFTSGTLLNTPEAGTLEYLTNQFYIRGTDGLSVAGNTGIGTTSPLGKLNIFSETDSNNASNVIDYALLISSLDGTTGKEVGIAFRRFSTQADRKPMAAITLRNTATALGSLHFKTAPASNGDLVERLSITSGGAVGVGETSPGAKLDIKGDGTTTGIALRTKDSGGSVGLTVLDSGKLGVRFAAPVALVQIDTLLDTWYANDGSKPTWLLSYSGTQVLNMFMGTSYEMNFSNPYAGASNGGLHFQTGGLGTTYERLTILKDGKVGIGTTSPGYIFHVVGLSYFSGQTDVNNALRAASVRSTTYEGGSVGTGLDREVTWLNSTTLIGTTNKTAISFKPKLNTTALTTKAFSIEPTYNPGAGATTSNIDFFINRTETTIGSGEQILMDLQVNTVSKFKVMSNGNVGIGTVSPTALIHLAAGTATAGTAPLKFTSGTLLTNPELGTFEYVDDGTTGHLYFTLNIGSVVTRVQIV
jgi:hypothetical protein